MPPPLSIVGDVRVVESSITRYTLREDGIVVALGIKPDVERTRETSIESLDALECLVDGTPRPVLWDPREVPRLQPEAWRTVVERAERVAVAIAILTDPATDRMLGVFPDTMDALLVPVRTFTDETAAVEWLREFIS